MFRFLITLLSSLIVTACIPTQATRAPQGLEKQLQGPTGLIFGSIGAATPDAFTSQSLFFRMKGSTESGQIIFIHDGLMNVPLDIIGQKMRGTLFSTRLPIGEYEIHQVSFFINRAQLGTTTFYSKEIFSIPFKVEEGKSTYLGEFVASPFIGSTRLGTAPIGGYFVVSDQMERDKTLLSSKPESVSNWPVINSIPDPKIMNIPIFRSAKDK